MTGDLTKEQRRQIAAEEVREILAMFRGSTTSKPTLKGIICIAATIELLLTDGDVSSKGMMAIFKREGVELE